MFSRENKLSEYFLLFIGLVILVGITPVSYAQQPVLDEQNALITGLNTVSEQADGSIILSHPDYQATFSTSGISVLPVKNDLVWGWQLAKIRGKSPEFVPPSVVREGFSRRISYQRGAIEEQYLIKLNSVEQRFVMTSWDGNEDFVLQGVVSSNGMFEESRNGWTWQNEWGEVFLGKLFVFDARGKEIPATFSVNPNSTEMRIEASELASAVFPVTLDPEIGTNDFRISDMGTNGNTSFQATSSAIAYNPNGNEYLVVWSGDDNTGSLVDNEYEIFGQLINASTGAEIGSDFRISDMGPNGNPFYAAINPAVAFNSAQNEYLVVWEGDDNTGFMALGEFEIFGQVIQAVTGSEVGSDFRISDMGEDGDGLYDAHSPDVAYNSTDDEFMVVWHGDDDSEGVVEGEFEIYGQIINGSTYAEVGSDTRYSDMGPTEDSGFDAEFPAVVYNSFDREYCIVWQGDDNAGSMVNDEIEIFAQRVDGAGEEVDADFRLSDMGPNGNASYDALTPDIAYNSTIHEYLVVWTGDDNTGGLVDDEFEIYYQRVDPSKGSETGSDTRISDMGPDGSASFDATDPAVAHNSTTNEYLVVWHGDDDSGSLIDNEYEVYAQRINGTSGSEVGTDYRLTDMGSEGNTNFTAQFPAVAANTVNNQFLIVWEGDEDISPLINNEMEIFGQRFTPTCTDENPLVTSAGTYQSATSNTISTWRHFCTTDGDLLLSLDLSSAPTAVIPSNGVMIELGAAPAVFFSSGTGFISNPDGAAMLTRKWDVDATTQPGPLETVGVRYYYTEDEYDALNDTIDANDTGVGDPWTLSSVTNMEFYKVTNDALGTFPMVMNVPYSEVQLIHYHATTPSVSQWTAGTHGTSDHYAEFLVTSFSGGGGGAGAGGGAQTFPVEILSFSGENIDNQVFLNWDVEGETNSKGFQIQRSADASIWENIGFVESANVPDQVNSYHYTDDKPILGNNYYRLKQVDLNGDFTLSQAIEIFISAPVGLFLDLDVFPNPAKDVLNIGYSLKDKGMIQVVAFNSIGQEVTSFELQATGESGTFTLNLDTWQTGLYYLQFSHKDKQQTVQVVVE